MATPEPIPSHIQIETIQSSDNKLTPYLSAVREGNLQVLIYLEKEFGKTICLQETSFGENAFLVAAQYGQIEVIDHLLSVVTGYSFYHCFNNARFSAYMLAAQNGHLKVLKQLDAIDKKTKNPRPLWQTTGATGLCSMQIALQEGHVDIIEYLLTLDDRWLVRIGSNRSFLKAISSGKVPAIDYVLNQFPGSLSQTVRNGNTLFMEAIKTGSLPAVQFLYSKKPGFITECNDRLETPLHIAAELGEIPMIQCVMALGCPVGIISSKETPLDVAERHHHLAAKDYFQQANHLFHKTQQGNLHFVRPALKKFPLTIRNSRKDTLLHLALSQASPQNLETANWLIEQGIDTTLENRYQLTAFEEGLLERTPTNTQQLLLLFKMLFLKKSLEEGETSAMAVRENLKNIINTLQKKNILPWQIHFKLLAEEFDKQYWISLAEHCFEMQTRNHTNFTYPQQADLINKLLYTGSLRCVERAYSKDQLSVYGANLLPTQTSLNCFNAGCLLPNGYFNTQRGTVSFQLGPLLEETQRKAKVTKIETRDEQFLRLKWALFFAIEAENFEDIICLYLQLALSPAELYKIDWISYRKFALGIQSWEELFRRLGQNKLLAMDIRQDASIKDSSIKGSSIKGSSVKDSNLLDLCLDPNIEFSLEQEYLFQAGHHLFYFALKRHSKVNTEIGYVPGKPDII